MKKISCSILVSAVLCILLSSCATFASKSAPSGFVHVSEAVPDVILEIRYHSTYNFVGDRIDGYDQPTTLLIVEAAKALKAVSDDVQSSIFLFKNGDSGFQE